MKPALVLLAAVLLLAGCGQKDPFVGTWRHDPQSATLAIIKSGDGYRGALVFRPRDSAPLPAVMKLSREGDRLVGFMAAPTQDSQVVITALPTGGLTWQNFSFVTGKLTRPVRLAKTDDSATISSPPATSRPASRTNGDHDSFHWTHLVDLKGRLQPGGWTRTASFLATGGPLGVFGVAHARHSKNPMFTLRLVTATGSRYLFDGDIIYNLPLVPAGADWMFRGRVVSQDAAARGVRDRHPRGGRSTRRRQLRAGCHGREAGPGGGPVTFLRRLFGKDANPGERERVRCDACDGKGVILSTLLTQADGGHVETHRCWKCRGKGWLLVKKVD